MDNNIKCGDFISVVFYDMTTLYFEAAQEDGLRKTGFSKDGKHAFILDLLVAPGGNPFGYEIYDGVNNTMLLEKDVLVSYPNLWFIERAFRINKGDLIARPIYHRLHNRIEAHISICFTA